MPDLTELQRLAEGATPGPWEAYTDCPGECCWLIRQPPEDDGDFTHEGVTWPETSKEDAAYIAAMSPDTAKKLIAVALAAQECCRAWDVFEATEVGHFNEQIMLTCEAADAALRTALEELK